MKKQAAAHILLVTILSNKMRIVKMIQFIKNAKTPSLTITLII